MTLDQVREQVRAALAAHDGGSAADIANRARAELLVRCDDITAHVAVEGRSTLLADEQRRFDALRRDVHELDALIEQANAMGRRQFAEFRREYRDSAAASQRVAEQWADRAADPYSVGRPMSVRSEPHTYSPDADRRGQSFFADVAAAALGSHDPRLHERLERHVHEAIVDGRIAQGGMEVRDVGTSAFTGLVVPQYLTDLVAPLARAMAPTVAIANKHPLPPDGMTVGISRITTGTAVGAQSSEADAVQETDIDDTLLTVNVRTYSGMQDVSRQAVERGSGVDTVLMEDLSRAYWTKVDSDVINGAGTNGTHLGIRSTANIISVQATSATAAGLWPKLADLLQQIQTSAFQGATHFVMHPRRWWWLASRTGTDRPFLGVEGAGDQGGEIGGTQYFATDRQVFGVPVILDGNIPINLGASTNEDVILGVSAPELHYWDEGGPRFIRAEQTLASTLQIRYVLYGYSAATAGRVPGACGTITSSALVTPVFA